MFQNLLLLLLLNTKGIFTYILHIFTYIYLDFFYIYLYLYIFSTYILPFPTYLSKVYLFFACLSMVDWGKFFQNTLVYLIKIMSVQDPVGLPV